MNTQTKHIESIDFLRMVAIFGVLLQHCTVDSLELGGGRFMLQAIIQI